MASAGKSSIQSGPSRGNAGSYALCVANDGYEASVERFKVNRVLPATADESPAIRVVDETGEDYLYDASRFVEIEILPAASALLSAQD